jgi:acyl dehydratase
MAGLSYEEFSVGQVFEHPWTRTVTETDNLLFSALTMNVQPLHLDAAFAAKSEFGQRIVNSDRKSTRLNSSHEVPSSMPSSA